MNATQNSVTNARDWLLYMGNAARALNITIQYCMPLPLHLLQSVEIPRVTQSRVSDDYNPGNSQWKLGFPSILAWAVGIFPFKDDFWTTSTQPGCPYGSCVEPNPVLETLVAALSSGPIGPSDSIGNLNVDLISKTCTKTGKLLKPDKPATALDSSFILSPAEGGSLIEVWDTFTQFGGNRWHYVLAADLAAPYNVTAADLALTGVSSVVVDYFALAQGGTNTVVSLFDDEHLLTIPDLRATLTDEERMAGVVPFKYYLIAPILQSKYVVLGETSKFIPVSHQRIVSFTDDPRQFSFVVAGTPGERFEAFFYDVLSGKLSSLSVTLRDYYTSISSEPRYNNQVGAGVQDLQFIIEH